MAADPQDPEQIAKGWIKSFYGSPPAAVLNAETGFPPALSDQASARHDPVPQPEDPDADWRASLKAWFDAQP